MRYLPQNEADRAAMLAKIGVSSIDDLYVDVPAAARLEGLVDLPLGKGELEVERVLGRMAKRNLAAGDSAFFVGAGAYRHHIPASVDHLIQRSEFLTAYTPYQPEISQGTLQTLFEFQTQVATLTGMDVANAGMYDGSTSAAEAVQMARRLTRRHKAVLSGGVHPQYRDVIETLAAMSSGQIDALPPNPGSAEDLISRHRRRHRLRRRPVALVLRRADRPRPDRRGLPRQGRAAGRGRHRDHGAGCHRAARSPGRRHRRRRRPVARQPAHFRRTLCRPPRHPREIRPPDARAPVRPDRRCRRQARLRADAFDPRTAYPPRKGDLEYLHQFGPVRPRLLDPSRLCSAAPASSGWRRSITPRR